MSHAATNWAIKQRGLKPATKIVLWYLCDRYHPDFGCFPSQEHLADDCEMSRSSLNVHLAELERVGLVRREEQRDPETKRKERTHYHFPFEEDWAGPCRESGQGEEASSEASTASVHVANPDKEPSPENDESRVANPDNNISVREPVRERETHAPERETPFQRIVKNYPGVATDDIAKAKIQFDALPSEDRRAAESALPRWTKYLEGQRRRPPLAEYLRDRKWTLIPEQKATKPTPEGELARSLVQPFDRSWWWLFFDCLKRNDQFRASSQSRQAKDNVGWKVDPAKRDEIEEAGKRLVQIEVDGPAFEAWKRAIADLPRPDRAKFIFVPSEFPPKQQGVTAKEIAEAWPE